MTGKDKFTQIREIVGALVIPQVLLNRYQFVASELLQLHQYEFVIGFVTE